MEGIKNLKIEELSLDEANVLTGGYAAGGGSTEDPQGLINTGNCSKAGAYNKNCSCDTCRPPIEVDPNGLVNCDP